ncbi:glucose-1-phosphate thymidylyltransferase RfbA [Labrenzia sp. DG1229]|uniref:glucose-1-phosphate thymidylyltransferase RfbA n=1 Tax=Labrenzia sp. DG1229 TaxID=681847 RepID=UPI00048F142A|nr:glucose-1-phosphate thymidylyltransferase RfbA [Labrenzia sp. DG1229]
MTQWKGLILAGGTGSRLFPVTKVVNKHLLPVYDKPMIYYPLSTLMLGGIRDFVLLCAPDSISQFQALLGDGSHWGITIEYVSQISPKGIADGFIQAENQLKDHNVALILGDNIFFGTGLPGQIKQAMSQEQGATIFGYEVTDTSQFGVVEVDETGKPVSIREKPKSSNSKLAVPGLYFYDSNVIDIAKKLSPSQRGELEISDLNRVYLADGELKLMSLGRGTAWLDGGTTSDLFEASQFIKTMENRTGMKIACLEEIAFRMNFVSRQQLTDLIDAEQNKNEYYAYVKDLIS